MSGVEPTKIDFQGLKMISEDETQTITLKMDGTSKGVILDYDLTTLPKQFKITHTGFNWTDGSANHTTGLERLALVETAFQAVVLPPNATTLEINDTIELNDGTNNALIGIDGGGNLLIDPSLNLIVNGTLDMSNNDILQVGKLGVGTATPASTLEVRKNALGYAGVFYNTSATGEGLAIRGGNTSSQNSLVVQNYDGNNPILIARSDGNVGIGTNAPALTLDVSGGSIGNSAGDLTLNVNSTGVGGALKVAGGTGVLSGLSGGNSGQHLVITINGVVYKIKLELP